MSIEETVKDSILGILEKNNVVLHNILFEKDNGEYFLRIFIDSYTQEVDLDICTKVNNEIGELLDLLDIINHQYYLEVSTAGAEKELFTDEHLDKSLGKYIHIELNSGLVYEGYLKENHFDKVIIECFSKGKKTKCLIEKANIKLLRLAVKF